VIQLKVKMEHNRYRRRLHYPRHTCTW